MPEKPVNPLNLIRLVPAEGAGNGHISRALVLLAGSFGLRPVTRCG